MQMISLVIGKCRLMVKLESLQLVRKINNLSVQLLAEKKHFGKVVLTNLTADSKQKYSGGKIINPINGMTFNSDIVVNGDTATVKIYKGVKGFGFTQVWQRQK